jgi:hypothetical protein
MMTNVHRRLLSSSSFSLAAGEARSLPRPRLEDVSREAHAPDPAAALLSLAAARGSHVRAPSPGRGHSRQGSSDDDESLLPPPPIELFVIWAFERIPCTTLTIMALVPSWIGH